MTSFLGLLRSALLLSWCAHDFLCCKLTAYEAESTRDSIEKKIVATKSGRTVGNVFFCHDAVQKQCRLQSHVWGLFFKIAQLVTFEVVNI
jgi:hypothetical protein